MPLSAIHSLRFKLLLMFVAVFAVLALLIGMIGVRYHEAQLRRQFQDRLLTRAASMVSQVQQAAPVPSDQLVRELIAREGESMFFRDFYVQILDDAGRLRGVSPNLGDYMLPTDAVEGATRPQLIQGYFELVVGPEVEQIAGPGQTLQMVTVRAQTSSGEPFYLQVAASLEAVEWSVDNLVLIYWAAAAMGMIAAAAAGWFVAGRVVRRINRIARLASDVGPTNLGERIAAPSTTDEIAELVLRLNSMLDRLEAGYHSQERFIQDASHELKTPIATLLTEAQVMKLSHPESEEVRSFAASVEDEMRRIGRMLESLLTLTRVDRLRELNQAREVTLGEVALDAVEQCRPAAQRKDVRLHLKVPEDRQTRTVGDPELLVVAINNLLRNAIRFCPEQGTVIVEVNGASADGASLRVLDCGPGLPEGDPMALFERFGHGPPDLARRGAGLGLAIVRTIVKLHHGEIWAHNRPEGGAEFGFKLPAA